MASEILNPSSCGRSWNRLEHLTVGCNILEGIVAILSGVLAGSVAIMGFAIDSGVESCVGRRIALAAVL